MHIYITNSNNYGDSMTIRNLRKAKKVSQFEIAQKLNLSQAAVSMYETGERIPNIRLIPKLAEILQCSIEEIVYCFCD